MHLFQLYAGGGSTDLGLYLHLPISVWYSCNWIALDSLSPLTHSPGYPCSSVSLALYSPTPLICSRSQIGCRPRQMIIKCERHDASFFGGGGVYHRNQSRPRISQNLGCVSPKTLFWNVENCNAMVVMLQLGTFPSESNFKSSVVCHLQHNTTPLTSSNLKLNFTWKWRWTELSESTF